MQNKLHWAISGKTAAEIIYSTADAEKAHMGLTSCKNAPEGKILKSVSAYLDLAENRAERQITTSMADWITFLDRFLELSDYPILADKGKVSGLEAKLKADQEYGKYRQTQDQMYLSDFDRQIKQFTSGKEDDPTH